MDELLMQSQKSASSKKRRAPNEKLFLPKLIISEPTQTTIWDTFSTPDYLQTPKNKIRKRHLRLKKNLVR
jgi:hypothetical protein